LICSAIPVKLAAVIRAVIFDLDGTLVHSLSGIATSLNRVLAARGLATHPEARVRSFIGNGIVKLVERAVEGEIPAEKVHKLAQDVGEDYAASWQQGTIPYPGVSTVLGELTSQGIGIAVLSNKPDAFCREMTDFLFPGIAFAAVIGQRESVPLKPDPAGALEVARLLETPPAEIAFVGDSTVDIATARNAGMVSVACGWGYHDLPVLKAASPDHLIEHINGLVSIINRDPSQNAV
jgi:phosphoglycolate phosphatase